MAAQEASNASNAATKSDRSFHAVEPGQLSRLRLQQVLIYGDTATFIGQANGTCQKDAT